jgi:histidine triad (HIT) family protein
MKDCVFCSIVAGSEPASVIYEDASIMALMTRQPTRPGECLIIPKAHIDHFTDLDDDTACRIMVGAQAIGRNIMQHFQPLRVGMVVHGFGVPHAHFILVPQHDPFDITSARFASIEDGEIVFDQRHIPWVERSVLDEHARLLRIQKRDVEEA